MSSADTLSEEIDHLLERYLHLLDQYTTLREQLSVTQSSLQQHIARANFTADRGIRYGQDQYDDRMQATKVLDVDTDGKELHIHINPREEDSKTEESSRPADPVNEEETSEEQDAPRPKSKDPLRMFGILVPQALRVAHAQSIKLVDEIIPKLVNVNMEMERVEIEIRRKRKHKAKAETKTSLPSEPQNATVKMAA